MTTYTGDMLIKLLDEGNYDIEFVNGNPLMTDGLESMSIMAVFGEDWWGNDIVRTEAEKMKSKFPGIIKRNIVIDQTVNDGTKAIEESLEVLVSEKIAKSVTVTGEIFSVHGILWTIEIEALTDETLKFFINWERGELTAKFVNG